MRLLLLLAAAAPLCALAQRADDNAVRSADDAFGNSVGNENIGLYNPFEVRGFSAVDAGNVRLDGLYFDRQTDPSRLIVPSSTMRVGISAQGYLLPAPTGIVDYELRRAGENLRVSPVVGWGRSTVASWTSSSRRRSSRNSSALRAACPCSKTNTRTA
jgi:iron complex outermembrane receptor protein